MTKKVLLISNIFPPAIGGPATFGVRLGERLSRDGYRVTFVCATAAPAEMDGQYPFKVIRAGTKGNRLLREMNMRCRLALAMLNADMVYCMGLEHQTHWAARITRKKYTLRIGGDSVWERARNAGITRLEPESFYRQSTSEDRAYVHVEERRRIAQLGDASAIIYVSNYLKNLAQLWSGKQRPPEFVVPNAIEPEEAHPVNRREDGELLRVLFVGRQTNWKGVDAVLLAVSRVEGAVLTVAGSGPAWPGSADLAVRLGLSSRAEFLDRVHGNEVQNLMRSHHVLVLPSLYEGMSNTLIEAGAAGLACIASNRGGNPELILDGESGLLVDPFDTESLAALLTLLMNDEERRVELATRHQERIVREFKLPDSIRRTIQILEGADTHNADNNVHVIARGRRRRTGSDSTGGRVR